MTANKALRFSGGVNASPRQSPNKKKAVTHYLRVVNGES